MTPLFYLNKELHTAAGRRSLHEPRKPDLQRLSRDARIQARKRQLRTAPPAAGEASEWLTEGLRLSRAGFDSWMRETAAFTRRHPLPVAAASIVAGMLLGLLMRRR